MKRRKLCVINTINHKLGGGNHLSLLLCHCEKECEIEGENLDYHLVRELATGVASFA